MKILRLLFAVSACFLLQGSGCSTRIEKLEMDYKEDFSGSAKATINVYEHEENGKKSVSQDELDELYKTSNACDVSLREIYGYNKKFTAEYKFSSYEELRKATECSKKTLEHVIFYPLEVNDGILTKDVTLKMTMFAFDGSFSGNIMPHELIITVPGEIKNVSFDYIDNRSFEPSFIINEKSDTAVYEVIGSNKVSFKIIETFKKTTKKTTANFEQKIKARCGSDDKSEEVQICYKRELALMVAENEKQIKNRFGEEFNEPGFRFTITTRINKLSKLFN